MKRVPRAHLSSDSPGPDIQQDNPAVSPMLVDHLAGKFPVKLAPKFPRDQAILTLDDQAEQRGQQQVIDYLRQLSQNQL